MNIDELFEKAKDMHLKDGGKKIQFKMINPPANIFLLIGLLAILIVASWILYWRLDMLEVVMPLLRAFTITWFVLLILSLISLFLFLIIYKEDN